MKLDRIDYNGGEIWVDKKTPIAIDEAYIHHGITHNEKEDYNNLCHCHKPTRNIEGRSELFVDGMFAKDCWKVVAQSITNPFYIDGVPFVEVGEDIYSLAALEYPRKQREAFIEGYKTAKAKQFTEEDLRNAIDMAREREEDVRGHSEYGYHNKYSDADIINSLKPKVVSIEIQKTWVGKEYVDEQDAYGYDVMGPETYQKDGKTFLKIKQ